MSQNCLFRNWKPTKNFILSQGVPFCHSETSVRVIFETFSLIVAILPLKWWKSHKIGCVWPHTHHRAYYSHVVIVLPVSGRHGYRWHLSRHDEHGVHSAAPGREWESARCKRPFFLNVPFRHSRRYCSSSFVNHLVDSLRNRLVLVIIIAIPRLVGDN